MKGKLFEDIVHDYGQYVYNQALRLTCNPTDAEDLAQDVLLQAWRHLEDLKEERATASWLRTICLNEFRMKLRRDKRLVLELSDDIGVLEQEGRALMLELPSPETEVEVSEAIGRMRDGCFLAMAGKLTLNQRVVFSMIDMFGLSIEETSRLLELTPKAVKGLLYRARVSLEAFFRGHCYFLDVENPCSCQSWISFMEDRDAFQKKAKELTTVLECKDKDFRVAPAALSTMLSYYQRIPERKPDKEWYDKILSLMNQL